MTKIILISVLLIQLTWCYAYPASQGVGVYSYQDTAGNRYGGTFDPRDTFIPYSDPFAVPFNDIDYFFPDYFRNFENILQQIFGSDIESQRLALHAANKAFDITYNHAGYNPNFFRLPQFTGSPLFGPGRFRANMDNNAHQSAFASAVVAPGYRRQIAAIDPINPGLPNVDVTNRAAETDRSNPNFVSVSSSSYASSANIDGKVSGMRGSETVVNENGKVTKYEVHS
ncbi:uncharacterized protein LOC113401062 isoform X1 [Vanessa tameamea]|uniref:Uncharacterized protein LOC113401062 isoform X1 n=1 Tax=Vanessa tameamea TaxID=334116 RepID=A0A8B8IHL5_VANTA|nr:uncharacterized protein LOC113401062 isoform X1 [Vanessa tameamea]